MNHGELRERAMCVQARRSRKKEDIANLGRRECWVSNVAAPVELVESKESLSRLMCDMNSHLSAPDSGYSIGPSRLRQYTGGRCHQQVMEILTAPCSASDRTASSTGAYNGLYLVVRTPEDNYN